MKPSQKIKEIEAELFKEQGYPERFFNAVLQYLDEEWEKNNKLTDTDGNLAEVINGKHNEI